MSLYLYNTLTRQKEIFQPIGRTVGLYTCGPTVYHYAHLGNLRAFVFEDSLKRVLLYNKYKVRHVMNITDVGHLTGDQDMGEDKLEIGAKREGKSAYDIAEFYTRAFKDDEKALNILPPDIWCKATETIGDQIKLIRRLDKKGFVYKTSDGLYFDTAKFPRYNRLSHLPLAALREGARVEKNPDKKNPTDFAVWKFSPVGVRRQMEWASPWGVGFPGWHLECSAMSLKYLKNKLDIHCGGIDHINIHHTNEIAQSEAATGQKFFNYWLHCAFLNLPGGKKMAKSQGNFLTLRSAVADKGLDPLAFRYACLQTHYRNPMEYSEESLSSAQNGLDNLYKEAAQCFDFNYNQAELAEYTKIPGDYLSQDSAVQEYITHFHGAINDDLNMPSALAILWLIIKNINSPRIKASLILNFDQVLGLNIYEQAKKIFFNKKAAEDLPEKIKELKQIRQEARDNKNWVEADALRQQIESLGYRVEDGVDGMKIFKQ